jgi:hypothetical protein
VAPPSSANSYLRYAGDWVASQSYLINDVVRYQSNSYIAVVNNTNSTPVYADTNANWKRVLADETVTSFGALVHGSTNKTLPIDADEFPILDSAASFITKRSTLAQVRSGLQGTGSAATDSGFRGIPQNAQSGNYTLVLADAGKHLFHASGDGAGDVYTIPANSSVAFPVGTAVTFVNLDSNTVSIAITTDTMTLCGTGSTGTRTLAQYGEVTALKVTSTSWVVCGTGAT